MLQQILDRVKTLDREQVLILLLAGVLLLIIAIPTEKQEHTSAGQVQTEAAADTSEGTRDRARELEEQLQQLLSQVEGVGKAEVMLTFKSDGRRIVEKDLEESSESSQRQDDSGSDESSQSSSSESTVFRKDSDGSEAPYVTESLEPEISGVLVIAQGAQDAAVVKEITDAVMALFGVEAHKIKVMKME